MRSGYMVLGVLMGCLGSLSLEKTPRYSARMRPACPSYEEWSQQSHKEIVVVFSSWSKPEEKPTNVVYRGTIEPVTFTGVWGVLRQYFTVRGECLVERKLLFPAMDGRPPTLYLKIKEVWDMWEVAELECCHDANPVRIGHWQSCPSR
jgi:hypothetical protein